VIFAQEKDTDVLAILFVVVVDLHFVFLIKKISVKSHFFLFSCCFFFLFFLSFLSSDLPTHHTFAILQLQLREKRRPADGVDIGFGIHLLDL